MYNLIVFKLLAQDLSVDFLKLWDNEINRTNILTIKYMIF